MRLYDACGLDPGPEHVLLGGYVVGSADAVQGVQVIRGAVVQLVLPATTDGDTHKRCKCGTLLIPGEKIFRRRNEFQVELQSVA